MRKKTYISSITTALSALVLIPVLICGIGCAGNKPKPHDDDIYGSRAYGYFLDGHLPLAIDTYKKGYVSARRTDNVRGAAVYLSNIGRVFYETGAMDSAVLYHKKSYEEFKALGDGASASSAAAFLALCLATGGDGDQARQWLKTAAESAGQKGSEHYLAVIQGMIDIRLTAKITDEGAVDAALAYYKKLKDNKMLSTIYILKADDELSKSAYPAAEEYLKNALTAIESSGERYKRSRILLRLAKIKFRAGDESAGKHYYERAVDCAPKGVTVPPIEEVTR